MWARYTPILFLLLALTSPPTTAENVENAEPVLQARPLQGLRANAVALILKGEPGGAFPAVALAAPRSDLAPDEKGRLRVDLWAAASRLLDKASTTADQGLRLEIYAYAVRPDGSVGGHLRQSLRMELDEHGEVLRQGGVRFGGHLNLPPGSYELRVLFYENRTQSFALRVVDLNVPAPAPSDNSDGDNSAVNAAIVLPPFLANSAAPGKNEWITFQAAPRDGDPQAPAFDLTPANDGITWAGMEAFELAASPATEQAAAEAEQRLDKSLATSKRARQRRAIAESYRQVLEILATSGFVAAQDELFHLEETIAEAIPINEARQMMEEGQQLAARDLLAREPEALLPLAAFHLRAYQELRERSKTVLASHHGRRVLSLSRLIAAADPAEAVTVGMSEILVQLGRQLRKSGSLAEARSVLADAAEMDRRSTRALYEVALTDELMGNYEATVDGLRQLLRLQPDHRQARLRLAVNLRRDKRLDDAETELRRIADSGTVDWVTAVAYQELGRLHVQRRRFGDAVRVLEEAVARIPDDGALRLALAYAQDRNGDPGANQNVAEVLAAEALENNNSGVSPRFIYGHVPPPPRDLVRDAQSRLPLLAAALAASEKR